METSGLMVFVLFLLAVDIIIGIFLIRKYKKHIITIESEKDFLQDELKFNIGQRKKYFDLWEEQKKITNRYKSKLNRKIKVINNLKTKKIKGKK